MTVNTYFSNTITNPQIQVWWSVLPPRGRPFHLACSDRWNRLGNILPQVSLSSSSSSPLLFSPTLLSTVHYFDRLAIINNVPVGRRKRDVEDVFWPQIGDNNLQTLAGNFIDMEWMPFDVNLPQSLAKVESDNFLVDLVKEITSWKKEEDQNHLEHSSSEKTTIGKYIEDKEEEEESCLVSTWRCMSSVLEEGVTCFQRPGGFQR